MATVAGTVTMFTSRQIQFPQLRHDLWFCRQTMSGLRWPCPAPVDSETTEDAAPSFRSTTGLRRVVIQTLNTSAAPPTATAVVPGNIAPATLASTTGRPEVIIVQIVEMIRVITLSGGSSSGSVSISGRVRSDRRCGPEFPLDDGEPSECDGSSGVSSIKIKFTIYRMFV